MVLNRMETIELNALKMISKLKFKRNDEEIKTMFIKYLKNSYEAGFTGGKKYVEYLNGKVV